MSPPVGVLLPKTIMPRFRTPDTEFPPSRFPTKLFCAPNAAAMLWFWPKFAAQARRDCVCGEFVVEVAEGKPGVGVEMALLSLFPESHIGRHPPPPPQGRSRNGQLPPLTPPPHTKPQPPLPLPTPHNESQPSSPFTVTVSKQLFPFASQVVSPLGSRRVSGLLRT